MTDGRLVPVTSPQPQPTPEEKSLHSASGSLEPEVLVIGAGPAGSATAAMLAQQGIDVLLVDKRAFPRDKICGDVVGPMAVDCLSKMGALDKVIAANAHRVDKVHIHSPNGRCLTTGFVDMLDTPNAYTLVVQRTDLDHALLNFARDSGAKVLEQTAVTRIEKEGDRIERADLQSRDGAMTVRPRYTVLATGANVGLLKRTGMLSTDARLIYGSRGYFSIDETAVSDFNLYYLKDLLPGYAWVFPTGTSRANIGMGAWCDRKLSNDKIHSVCQPVFKGHRWSRCRQRNRSEVLSDQDGFFLHGSWRVTTGFLSEKRPEWSIRCPVKASTLLLNPAAWPLNV